MFKFLIVLFFMFLLMVSLLGFSILRMLKNFIFGNEDTHKNKASRKHKSSSTSSSSSRTSRSREGASSRKKIISEDEGEYVDYEEVK